MSDNRPASILLNDEQRFFFEGLLTAYIVGKVLSYLRNPRTVKLDSIFLLTPSDWAFKSSAHLLGFTDLGQLKAWIDNRHDCCSVYKDKGFHLELHRWIMGENDQDNSPIFSDAIYLVRNGHIGDWPNDE